MPGDWDWVVIAGIVLAAAGLWLLFGPGAAMAVVGVALIVVGIGGAMTRR